MFKAQIQRVLLIHFFTTSVIPHLGQLPGAFVMTSACIGHVYVTVAGAVLASAGGVCECSAEWPQPKPVRQPQAAVSARIGARAKSL